MRHLVYSEAGFEHANEDCVRALGHPHGREMLVGALADGQGGQAGGGVAARLAVETCLALAQRYAPDELLQREVWREIARAVDRAVESDGEAGFSTLVAVCVTPSHVCGASCGDSAALLVANQNHVELTGEQRKNPPVGSARATAVAFAAPRAPGSTVLLASDGVWKSLGLERIAATARECAGANLVLKLRQQTLDSNAGKLPDDFSLLAVW